MVLDLDALFGSGLPLADGLVVKAQLRVAARKLRFPATQAIVDDLDQLYQQRVEAMLKAIDTVLTEPQSEGLYLSVGGDSDLVKAAKASGKPKKAVTAKKPAAAKGTKKPYERPQGGVKMPGSRGGIFYRDDHGNVKYGMRPTPRYHTPAEPEHVIAHFKKYHSSTPFGSPEWKNLNKALLDSDFMTETDKAMVKWWLGDPNVHTPQNPMINVFLSNFKKALTPDQEAAGMEPQPYTLEDIKEAGSLDAITWRLNDEDVPFGQALEAWWGLQVDMLAQDKDYFEFEDVPVEADDVVKLLREAIGRYDEAMSGDQRVFDEAHALVEAGEKEKQDWFLHCQQKHEKYEPLTDRILHSTDLEDATLLMTVALRDLGLMAGEKARGAHRGVLMPNASLIFSEGGQLWQDLDTLKDSCTAPQLMAVYVAERLQNSITKEFGYDPDHQAGGHFSNQNSRDVFNLILAKLKVPEAHAALVQDALERVVGTTAHNFSEYNNGNDLNTQEIIAKFDHSIFDNPDATQQLWKALRDREEFLQTALEKQTDTTFEMPSTMAAKGTPWEAYAKGITDGHEAKRKGMTQCLVDKEHPEKGVWKPQDYQKQYLNWMAHVKRGLIAQDAGLGKTPTVITFLEQMRASGKVKRGIIFVPPSLMEQWPQEIERFAPGSKVLTLQGMSLEERKEVLQGSDAQDSDYVIISTGTLAAGKEALGKVQAKAKAKKGSLAAHSEDDDDGTGGTDQETMDILRNLEGAVFIDEVHSGGYKSNDNARHAIAKHIIGDREYAFGMTATPVPNEVIDLYHTASLFTGADIGEESWWEGKCSGVKYDDKAGKWEGINTQHISQLNKRVKPYVFYKKISDPDVVAQMGASLPDKVSETGGDLGIYDHTNAETGLTQRHYMQDGGIIDKVVAARVAKMYADDPTRDPGPMQLIAASLRLTLQRLCAISPALIDPSYKRADGGVANAPKLDALAADIKAHFHNDGTGGSDGKPMVIFSSFPNAAFGLLRAKLAEMGVPPSVVETISGEVPAEHRGYIQDKLNAGHTKVLLLGTLSGGAGLNLQEAANRMAFLDEPWSPAQKRQAIGRVWRTKQKNTVYLKDYRLAESPDEKIETRLGNKQVMASALLGDPPDMETFNAQASSEVEEITGRIKRGKWDAAAIKEIMDNASKYALDSSEHVTTIKELSQLWSDDIRDAVKMVYKDGFDKPSAAAIAKLKKEAPNLAKEFDEEDFKTKWLQGRKDRMSGQNFRLFKTMLTRYSELLATNASPERTDEYVAKRGEYQRKIDRLVKDYPHLDTKGEWTSTKPDAATAGKKSRAKVFETAGNVLGPETLKKLQEQGYDVHEHDGTTTPEESHATHGKTAGLTLKTVRALHKAGLDVGRKVAFTNKMGLQFHSKEHGFSQTGSKSKKPAAPGSEYTEADAAYVFNALVRSKAKTWKKFGDEFWKPGWTEGKYSWQAAKQHMEQLVDVFVKRGLLAPGTKVK